jgi:serine protease inhibitor
MTPNCRRLIFIKAAEEARQTINAWVETNRGKNKFKELFVPGSLDSQIRLVLTNAIYFKGDWAEPFIKVLTEDAPFYIAHDKTVQAPLMHRKGDFRYARKRKACRSCNCRTRVTNSCMVVLLAEQGGLRHFVMRTCTKNRDAEGMDERPDKAKKWMCSCRSLR